MGRLRESRATDTSIRSTNRTSAGSLVVNRLLVLHRCEGMMTTKNKEHRLFDCTFCMDTSASWFCLLSSNSSLVVARRDCSDNSAVPEGRKTTVEHSGAITGAPGAP
jgi:hypothetical protein